MRSKNEIFGKFHAHKIANINIRISSLVQFCTNFYTSVSRFVCVISLRKQNLCHRGSRNAYVFTQKWSGWPFSNMLLENWYFFDWFDFWSKYLVHDPTQFINEVWSIFIAQKSWDVFCTSFYPFNFLTLRFSISILLQMIAYGKV